MTPPPDVIPIDSQPEIEAKIKDLDEIARIADRLRREGRTVVTNNGSYDLLHIGHVISLFEAARQGDVLIVGVNSDISVRAYKGPSRPIVPQQARVRMIAALPCVDYVTTFDEPVCIPFVQRVRPDVHTNGAEYGKDCIERQVVERFGGRIHLLPMVEGFHSSDLIRRILEAGSDRP
jgi:rfaE bifunctional protein nucleotidyltransferase chain/domain